MDKRKIKEVLVGLLILLLLGVFIYIDAEMTRKAKNECINNNGNACERL